MLYVLCKWSELQGLFDGRLKREHLCLLLLQYGLGHLSGENIRSNVFLEQVRLMHKLFEFFNVLVTMRNYFFSFKSMFFGNSLKLEGAWLWDRLECNAIKFLHFSGKKMTLSGVIVVSPLSGHSVNCWLGSAVVCVVQVWPMQPCESVVAVARAEQYHHSSC